MSQNVERLKQLLFEPESQALTDLAHRIEAVAELDATSRAVIARQIEHIFDRVGSGERLASSVSEILADALRRAEVARHDELAISIAPLVVSTIKTELRNSQDEMVEALYPITGRLVKSYVASALKDLADQMNRRLEQNPVMLRLQSLATGRSVGELALAGTQDFNVHELYLIRRGTGELLARWPERDVTSQEHSMSGILAAINEFATEAFAANQSSLREIDLGGEQIYLRASPLYLLAARSSGHPSPSLEELLDRTFLDAVEKQHEVSDVTAGSAGQEQRAASALAELGAQLNERIDAENILRQRPPARGLLKAVTVLILLPLAGWFGYTWYSALMENRVRETARATVASIPAMQGYPVEFDVSPRGKRLIVSGLTPSPHVRADVTERLAVRLPNTLVQDRLSVLPGPGPRAKDLSPELAKVEGDVTRLEGQMTVNGARRSADMAIINLEKSVGDLTRVSHAAKDDTTAALFRGTAKAVTAALTSLKSSRDGLHQGASDAEVTDIAREFARLAEQISASADYLLKETVPELASTTEQDASPYGGSDPDFAAQALAAATTRLQGITGAALFSVLRTPEPAPPPPPPQPTAEEKLRSWTTSHAIFFGNDTEYRDAEGTRRTLEELARLMADTTRIVRIIGYTDEAGGQARNIPLAQSRADRVRQELITLGVDPAHLVSVGRSDALDITVVQGTTSSNRRVEFELGFDGETAP